MRHFAFWTAAAPKAALLLAGSLGFGCGNLWDYYSAADPNNCLRNTMVCGSGSHCNTKTQACEPDRAPYVPEDIFPSPTAPPSFISPGGQVQGLAAPRDVSYVLAAPVAATIYYTLDGTVPMAGQGSTQSGQSPLALGALPNATALSWYADYGSPYNPESVHTFTATTNDNMPPVDYGAISENVYFASSKGPVALVQRGEVVGLRVGVQAWASTSTGTCANCTLQYVISVAGVGPVTCIDSIQKAGTYPGSTYITAFYFYAPMTTGRFPVTASITNRPICDGTTGTNGIEIGELFVH